MNESCLNCKYWLSIDTISGEDDDQAKWGLCRRYPPKLPAEENDYRIETNQHPVTDGVEWCGEWKASDEQCRN